ncbi:MAG: hypothetical protein J7500_09555 [Sphingomonas sp.]|uniref:DUF6644 family protein n=1 Tax=Sphingomonas sp. TaxID=28214 RepID=UPI001B0695E5|nr:DUF6644 family protein [Sphingomonas sp.]MBO9622944.1 hypothetical protein [Sphingomonas sp.]
MLSQLMAYLQYELGAQRDAAGHVLSDTSLSAQLQSSERLWMLLEGTHVLTLMLFAGTILFVDLRLLGVVLPRTPVSKVTSTVLPYTVGGFVVMILTGLALFFANPFEYYHNVVFRVKIGFLLAAAINIFLFHYRVQSNLASWDNAQRTPRGARIAAGVSLGLWIAVIVAGRYVAYDWFSCDNAQGLVAAVSECKEHNATLAALQPELAQ